MTSVIFNHDFPLDQEESESVERLLEHLGRMIER